MEKVRQAYDEYQDACKSVRGTNCRKEEVLQSVVTLLASVSGGFPANCRRVENKSLTNRRQDAYPSGNSTEYLFPYLRDCGDLEYDDIAGILRAMTKEVRGRSSLAPAIFRGLTAQPSMRVIQVSGRGSVGGTIKDALELFRSRVGSHDATKMYPLAEVAEAFLKNLQTYETQETQLSKILTQEQSLRQTVDAAIASGNEATRSGALAEHRAVTDAILLLMVALAKQQGSLKQTADSLVKELEQARNLLAKQAEAEAAKAAKATESAVSGAASGGGLTGRGGSGGGAGGRGGFGSHGTAYSRDAHLLSLAMQVGSVNMLALMDAMDVDLSQKQRIAVSNAYASCALQQTAAACNSFKAEVQRVLGGEAVAKLAAQGLFDSGRPSTPDELSMLTDESATPAMESMPFPEYDEHDGRAPGRVEPSASMGGRWNFMDSTPDSLLYE